MFSLGRRFEYNKEFMLERLLFVLLITSKKMAVRGVISINDRLSLRQTRRNLELNFLNPKNCHRAVINEDK